MTHFASLTPQEYRIVLFCFSLGGHPSGYQPRPTGFNFKGKRIKGKNPGVTSRSNETQFTYNGGS